ncbi:MAG: hypothetical protein Q9M91_04615 [Candidatus Dojkabacteria bacterium]|nr:hypothetical protein [Candidatus Dojkabacteria bacterium]
MNDKKINNSSTKITLKEVKASAIRTLKIAYREVKFKLFIITLVTFIIPLIPFAIAYTSTKVIDELVRITDQGLQSEGFSDELWILIIIFLSINIFDRIISTIQTYLDTDIQYNLGEVFTLQFLRKSSELDLYHYENPKQNDLIRKAKDSYTYRPQQFVGKMLWIIPDLGRIIVSMSIIAFFSPLFFLIISLSSLPALIVRIKTSKTVWHIWNSKTETRRLYDSAAGYLSDESSLMELRIFRTKNYLFGFVENLFNDFFSSERKANLKKGLLETSSTIVATIGILSFWVFAVNQVIEGNITIGLLTFYAAASVNYAGSLSNFSKIFQRYMIMASIWLIIINLLT